jgi:AcrR family transcriptional regulator
MHKRQAYHHPQLKQQLLRAATQLLAQAGPQGFTLREVARRAAVSHNAPYRHFRSKDELLATVAAEGFRKLTASMLQAASRSHNAVERLRLSGSGYVEFALRWPQHFLAMFDAAGPQRYAEYGREGKKAFDTLLTFVRQAQAGGALGKGDPRNYALTAWSLVHGIAKLAISKQLHLPASGVRPFTDLATRMLLHGMESGAQ